MIKFLNSLDSEKFTNEMVEKVWGLNGFLLNVNVQEAYRMRTCTNLRLKCGFRISVTNTSSGTIR